MDRQRNHPEANRHAKRLRRQPTPAEACLWKHLRKLEGFHFRRQPALGSYVFDFGDHGRRLLIEMDGGMHALPEVAARDRVKEAAAAALGYRVIRIPNDLAFGSGDFAIVAILDAAKE